jgi:hypothetical protein
MSDTTITDAIAAPAPEVSAAPLADCDECVGSGGWFRYEPALDPAPGLLYLSCVQCRGTGKTASAHG